MAADTNAQAARRRPAAGSAESAGGHLPMTVGKIAVWPACSGSPFSGALTDATKYVASRTLTEPLPWEDSILILASYRRP